MEFINNAYAQARDLVTSMTPAARITSALLLGVIVVSLGFLFSKAAPGPDEFLFGAEFLSSTDIGRIEAALSQAGLDGYETTGNRIRVPRGNRAAYMAAIADAGALPVNFDSMIGELIKGGSPWESNADKLNREKQGKQQLLSLIIRNMEGVKEAYVVYDEQQERGLRRNRIVTASVTVFPTDPSGIDPFQKKQIRNLVASSIAGMTIDDVKVISDGGAGGGGGSAPGGGILYELADDDYYKRRFVVEERMRHQIEKMLTMIPGVVVEVTAELDPATEKTVHDQKLGDTKPLSINAKTEESEQVTPETGGTPGTATNLAQGPGGATSAAQSEAKSTTNLTEELTENASEFTITKTHSVGGTPKDVRAAISIPSTYWVRLWNETNRQPDGSPAPEPSDADLKKLATLKEGEIENQVAHWLGQPETGESPYPKVQVLTYQVFDPEPPPQPAMTDVLLAWLGGNWTTLGMFVLAVFSLFMLRSMVKSVPSPALPDAEPTFTVESESSDEDDEEDDDGRPRLRLRRGPTLKDDLAGLVRDDPDAAAAILRTWISSAA